jgi:hypothetical protein
MYCTYRQRHSIGSLNLPPGFLIGGGMDSRIYVHVCTIAARLGSVLARLGFLPGPPWSPNLLIFVPVRLTSPPPWCQVVYGMVRARRRRTLKRREGDVDGGAEHHHHAHHHLESQPAHLLTQVEVKGEQSILFTDFKFSFTVVTMQFLKSDPKQYNYNILKVTDRRFQCILKNK